MTINQKEKKQENVPNSSKKDDTQAFKEQYESLLKKTQNQEKEILKKEEEIQKLSYEIKKKDEEIDLLKKFLFSLKGKSRSIEFIDVNDYTVESVISKGAISSVKIVNKKEQMKLFLSESEILILFRHPFIVRFFGYSNGDDNHPPSMILSHEPTSLEQAIHDKILEEHQKNRITVELVLGVCYIHKENFMHRDLKPSNILLSKNMHVLISDFGLAKEEDLETSQSKGVGMMRFMAPELFEEKDNATRYTNKVDAYSFGITLIYTITEKCCLWSSS